MAGHSAATSQSSKRKMPMSGRSFSTGEYAKIMWPNDYTLKTSFGEQHGQHSYTALLEYCETCGAVISFRNRTSQRKRRGHTIIQIAGPFGTVLDVYRELTKIVRKVRGNLHGVPTVREVNLFEIRDSNITGPIKDIEGAIAADKIPADPHARAEDDWTDKALPDWEESESETDDAAEEVKAVKKEEPSDSEEECPREAQLAQILMGTASSSFGEAGPPRDDGSFTEHNCLFNKAMFDPDLSYDILAFNVLFYRAVMWLQVGSPHRERLMISQASAFPCSYDAEPETRVVPLGFMAALRKHMRTTNFLSLPWRVGWHSGTLSAAPFPDTLERRDLLKVLASWGGACWDKVRYAPAVGSD